jgi:hypothetical protein
VGNILLMNPNNSSLNYSGINNRTTKSNSMMTDPFADNNIDDDGDGDIDFQVPRPKWEYEIGGTIVEFREDENDRINEAYESGASVFNFTSYDGSSIEGSFKQGNCLVNGSGPFPLKRPEL